MNYLFDSNGNYDEDIEDAYYESDDDSYDAYDDDSTDDDASERRKSSRGRTQTARGAKGKHMRPGQSQPYRGAATMNTPAGQAKVKLPPDLVSKKEFKALEAKVVAINEANLKNGKAIDVLNDNSKKLEARLDKSEADNKKKFSNLQMGSMMGAFLPPSLTSITVAKSPIVVKDTAGNITSTTPVADEELKVTKSSFDTTNAMLPMMFSGGMGGGSGSGSNDMMMPMMMMFALQGKDGKSGSSDLMLPMMMMMMYK